MLTTRTKIGWIAIALLLVSSLGVLPATGTGLHYFAGAAFKVGCVALLAWLAYPQLMDLPRLAKPIMLILLLGGVAFSPALLQSVLRVSVLVIPLYLLLHYWPRAEDRNST